jgi:hypothetical protein
MSHRRRRGPWRRSVGVTCDDLRPVEVVTACSRILIRGRNWWLASAMCSHSSLRGNGRSGRKTQGMFPFGLQAIGARIAASRLGGGERAVLVAVGGSSFSGLRRTALTRNPDPTLEAGKS